MGDRILVLTGSPRPGGNSDLLAEALIRGARSVGHSVHKYEAARHAVKGCLACGACFHDGQACPLDEEFSALAGLIEASDAVVLATPIYWLSFPVGLKAAVDKLYAFRVGGRSLAGKRCALLVCGEAAQLEIFTAVRLIYEDLVAYEGWTDRGVLAVPGMREKGEIRATGALERARALGREI